MVDVKYGIPLKIYIATTLQSFQPDRQKFVIYSKNKSRYIKKIDQIEKFVAETDSNMPPSVGIIF